MNLQHQIIKRISKLIAFFFIIEILLCWKLWFPINREFPMMSTFSWLDFSIGLFGNGILSLALLIALILILIDQYKNLAIAMLVSCLFIFILEDITRFQPWVYMQTALLILLNLNKNGRENAILSGALLLVALIYIWSGFQKLNLGFLKDTFPWLLSTFGFNFQIEADQPLTGFNYLFALIPLLELSIGLFLLIPKTRKIGIIIGLLMHLFILISLGPIGHHWNLIVLKMFHRLQKLYHQ